ncbi:hypothetical protein [uncultured Propionibacterium sp.]|nr:hypothetical protein [uncultured Propionibacterium sp.]
MSPWAVIWAPLLPPDRPGHGFVDERTPEVGVRADELFRGQGIGRKAS